MSPLVQSRRLVEAGFAHGFSTRAGGVSRAPFDALNLGRGLGDPDDVVEENHRRLAEAVGYEVTDLAEVSQVHGDRVLSVPTDESFEAVAFRQQEADAVFVPAASRKVAGIRTADCLPLLLADPVSGAVAAVHAGWRGVASQLALRAVAMFEAAGVDPSRLIAAIGPHIRLDAFEVGEEVADAIEKVAYGEAVVVWDGERPHVDLARTVMAQLCHAGLSADHMDDVGGCTLSEPVRFYSYRRDAADAGRHLSVIRGR